MTQMLPPFNLASRCPKCGMEGGQPGSDLYGHRFMGLPVARASDPFPVEYHAPYPLSYCSVEARGEHLHRTCPRCAFAWAEACPQFPDHPPAPVIPHVRPEVAAFALLMERELAAHHDDAAGWRRCSVPDLFSLLQIEAGELCRCLQGPFISAGRSAIQIGNLAMMIADVCGALNPKKEDVS